MPLRAGFAETDISPPMGTLKIGWIKKIVIDTVIDPIFARAAVLESDGTSIAFLQLDLLCIRWTEVAEIRRRITERYGFPGENVMVAPTHNHAGPAVVALGEVPRDEAYTEEMVERVVTMFGEALAGLREAKIGFGSVFEWRVSHNRRMVMRDGTVQTHSGYGNPDALYIEGPIDPLVTVLSAQTPQGELIGAVVHFACHPTHHGSDTCLSAGWPGALVREMQARGCPNIVFLNGAAGNLSSGQPTHGASDAMEEMGAVLAGDAMEAIRKAEYREAVRLGGRAQTASLPFRELSEEQIRGTARGAQRFIDPSIYDREMPALSERIRREGTQPAEVQALFVDEYAFVAQPGELFVQLGKRIEEACHPRRVVNVGFSNGYIGYVPHREAFDRGGYETTFGWGSFLAPEAGDMIVECAIDLVRQGPV